MKNNNLIADNKTDIDINSKNDKYNLDNLKSLLSNDMYSDKEEKLNKYDSEGLESTNIQTKDNKYRKTYDKSKAKINPNVSRVTMAVQKQIKENFSLDNLGKIELAEDHRSANRPLNKKKNKNFNKQTKFCQCCNLPCIQPGIIEPFSFTDNVENFAICGKGIYLYFMYISYAVFCFLIIILISSISFSIFSNAYYKNVINLCNLNITKCENLKKMKINLNEVYWSYKYSIDNIRIYKELYNDLFHKNINSYKYIINYSIINFFSMLILFLFNILFLYEFHYINNKLKKGILPSDYTLLITNLNDYYNNYIKEHNNDKYNVEKFTGFLKSKLFEPGTIHSINLCYKINEYMKAQKLCEEYKYKIFQIENNPYQKKKNEKLKLFKEEKCYFVMPFTLCECLFSLKKQENLKVLNENKNKKERELYNALESEKKLSKFAGCIFATFKTLKDKENYYNKYPHYFIERVFASLNKCIHCLNCFMNKEKKNNFRMIKNINVFYANEPEDVIWENMEYSSRQRLLRRLLIYFISILLLLILFFIVYQLTYVQNSLNEKEGWDFIKINIFSYLIALAIVIVNKLFQLLLEFLTEIEKPNSYSNLYLSCSIKLTVFSFITSSIIPYICNMKDKNLMVKNISNLFIVNSIVLPLPFTLITYFYKKFRIYLINRKPKEHYKTQKELNELYELPDMGISYKYSDVSQTILMTFFYMPIFPFGAIFSLIGLILTFYCQKFYFIHFYKRPEMLNESICKFYLEYFSFNLFIYAIGDYIFTSQIYEKKVCLFNLIFFAILTIIPYHKFILLYLDRNKIIQIESTPISKVYFSFYNDYERQNPLTKKQGLCKYINKLREKKYISERVKEIATNNVENINIMEVYYRTSIRHSLMKSQFTFVDKKNFFKQNFGSNELNNTIIEANEKTGSKFNLSEKEKKNNESNLNSDKVIIEEKDLIKIVRNNNSLMLESYKNPFLFGINDSIRFSLNIKESHNLQRNIDNNKTNTNIDNNKTNSINPLLNDNNKLYRNDKLYKIYEESMEQDIYNNYSGLMNENDLNNKIESKDSKFDLNYNNIYNIDNRSNNNLYKSSSFKKSEKSSFNDKFNISPINQMKKESREEGNHIDLTKSAILKKEKSFNEA